MSCIEMELRRMQVISDRSTSRQRIGTDKVKEGL